MPKIGYAVLTLIPVALLGVLAVPQFAPAKVVPPGTKLLYDDFEFTATRVEATSQIGSDKSPSGQSFYVVDVQVTNKAKRVDFTFDPSVVKPMTDTGAVLKPDSKAQATLDSLVTALGSSIKAVLAPSESENYRLVFIGKPDLTSLKVSFSFGGGVGTALDNVIYGKRLVDLPVTRD